MSLWLLLVISWCGGVSLQHVEDAPEPQRTFFRYPLTDYDRETFELSPYSDADSYRNEDDAITYYPTNGAFNADENVFGNYNIDSDEREIDANRNRRWAADLIDSDQTLYSKADMNQNVSAFSLDPPETLKDAIPDIDFNNIDYTSKRSFSPWGGKRGGSESTFDRDRYIWSWKRTPKESNMPKRVRFSPWGGKRSAHVIFKPNKATRVIYKSLTPEMWLQRLNSNSQVSALPLKSNRMKYRLLAFKRGEYNFLKNKRPFYELAQGANLLQMPTKEGKRKIKFSAWGGKRSPPVTGPVRRPATDSDNSLLNSIALFSDESTKNGRLKL